MSGGTPLNTASTTAHKCQRPEISGPFAKSLHHGKPISSESISACPRHCFAELSQRRALNFYIGLSHHFASLRQGSGSLLLYIPAPIWVVTQLILSDCVGNCRGAGSYGARRIVREPTDAPKEIWMTLSSRARRPASPGSPRFARDSGHASPPAPNLPRGARGGSHGARPWNRVMLMSLDLASRARQAVRRAP